MYDGDYLHVYEGDTKSFTYAFVDDAAPHATLLLASRGLLFYDDDYAHSWCKGSRAFDYDFAPDNVAAVRTTRRDAELLMTVDTTTFRLDLGTCDLTSR